MSKKLKKDILDYHPDLIFYDEFNDCIVGVVEKFGVELCVCYDKEKVINKLVADGMSVDEAFEYFEFNIIGAYVGEHTPSFINLINKP